MNQKVEDGIYECQCYGMSGIHELYFEKMAAV